MTTWQQGQSWRVVNSLNKLNEQIRAYAPRSVPPATDANAWGTIGDTAHSSTSDHYPHYYAALGSTAVVCARDFPHAPTLGLDGHVVTEALRVSRDPRIGYVIFDRHITGPNHGWRWDPYDGSDPHDTHFHVSSVHIAIADDARAWALPGGEPDMAFLDDSNAAIMAYRVDALAAGSETSRGGPAAGEPIAVVKDLHGVKTAVTELGQAVKDLAAAVAELRTLVQAGGTDPAVLEQAAFDGAQRAERE